MDKVELGSHAKTIIANKAYPVIFDMVRQHYREAWSKTRPNQEGLRETLYNTIVALEDVKRQIEALAVAGDNAIFEKEMEDK